MPAETATSVSAVMVVGMMLAVAVALDAGALLAAAAVGMLVAVTAASVASSFWAAQRFFSKF